MNKNKTKFSRKSESGDTHLLIIGTVIGCVSVFMILIFLTLIGSFIAMKSENPDSFTRPFAYIFTVVSLLVGGIIGAVGAKSRGLTAGVITGVICTAIAFSLHLILSSADDSSSASSLLFLIYPLICALGGYIGTPKQKKQKSRFKKRF